MPLSMTIILATWLQIHLSHASTSGYIDVSINVSNTGNIDTLIQASNYYYGHYQRRICSQPYRHYQTGQNTLL
jgi:hypothetical protein